MTFELPSDFRAFALLLTVFCAPGLALGQLIVEEDFESGRQPVRPTIGSRGVVLKPSGNAPKVVKVSDSRAGAFVMKSELSRSSKVRKRTEVEVYCDGEKVNFDVGKEYWVGVSIKLAEDFRDLTDFDDRAMILQWHYRDKLHPEVRDAQPLLLRFRKDQVHVENEVLQCYMATVPPAYGEWVDWVFHVKFADPDGLIQVWRQGKQIVDWHGDNHQAEKREGAYLKLGIYSSQYAKNPPRVSYRRTVYHDELRIAGSNGSYRLVAPPGGHTLEDKGEQDKSSGRSIPRR